MSYTTNSHSDKFEENHLFNVLDVRTKTDHILIFGDIDKLWRSFSKTTCNIHNTTKEKDLNSFILNETTFDKVIVVGDFFVPEPGIIKKLAQLVIQGGLLSFLVVDKQCRDVYNSLLEELYPRSEVWQFNSNFGEVLVTTANGVPQFN